MITEDYVSFETAKLLKEKGFNEEVICYYDDGGSLNLNKFVEFQCCNEGYGSGVFAAPTLQNAMKWLREVHHIHTEICLYKTNESDVEPMKSRKVPYYTFGVWDTITGDNIDKRFTNDFIGDTYEEACEAALKYCIENLI